MRISVSGTALPTVPMRKFSKVFTFVTGLVSVSPYPSRILSPAAKKNLLMPGERGAPPLTKKRSRPPTPARSLLKTSLSARDLRTRVHHPGVRPSSTASACASPTDIAHPTSAPLRPVAPVTPLYTRS